MKIKEFFRPIGSPASWVPTRGGWWPWSRGQRAIATPDIATSYGGVIVTPELALTLSSVWACVFRYANTISTLPLQLMKTGPNNSATVAGQEELYTILHDRPNEHMSASAFWQAMISSMLIWGRCYARKIYIGSRLVALLPMRPERMSVYRTPAGKVRFIYALDGMEPEDIGAEEVFSVFDRSVDGYVGLSRIEYARNSYGLAISAENVSGVSYRNGLRVSGVLTVGQWLNDAQREQYRTTIAGFMGGGSGLASDRQGGVMVLENATKFEPMTMKPADVELLSSRRFSVEEVCRWFDCPPILIGHSAEGQTMWGSGVEQIILGWLKLGLAPILRRIEQEIWRQLLTSAQQATFFAEYNLEGLLRGDSAARAAFYSTMSQNGVYTRNEIRARENLPPVEGGDVVTVQSNLVELAKVGGIPAPLPAEAASKAALRGLLDMDSGKDGRT